MTEAQKTEFFKARYYQCTDLMDGRSRRSSVGFFCRPLAAAAAPAATNPRPVTPTATAAIDKVSNADIKALLNGVINPACLAKDDLFVDEDSSFDTLRSRVIELGIKKQTEANGQRAATFKCSGKTDLSSLTATQTHRVLLKRHCLPRHKRSIQGALLYALAAHNEDPSLDIFQLPRLEGGKETAGPRLLPIVPSDSEANLQTNGRRWLPKLHQAMAPDLGSYKCAHQLMMIIRHHCKLAFDAAATDKGPNKQRQMDPHRQIAMCHKTGVTTWTLREMRPFLNADGCNPFLSERQIRKCQVSPTVKAVISSAMEKKMNRVAFYLPADEVVIEDIKSKSVHHPTIEEVHAMWSGDHGQGAFRSSITTVGIVGSAVKYEKHSLVGQIDCKQDTRKVLADSGVIAGINDGLKRLLQAAPICLPTNAGAVPPPPVRIRLKATGDLAFYSLILKGRSKMAGHHCWRCLARWKEFQDDPFFMGEKLTLASLKERHRKLESGELDRKDKDQERGVMTLPLLDCVEPADWLCPVLHAVDLLVNKVYDYLQMWVWCRIEDVPMEMITARMNWARTTAKRTELKALKEAANAHLEAMKAELESLKFDGALEGDDDYEFQCDLCQVAGDDLRDIEVDFAEADKDAKAAKAKLTKLQKNKKKYGRSTQDLWMKIQRLLRDLYNIHISSYHGGDMEGNECRRLLREADEVMDVIQNALIQHLDDLPETEKPRRAGRGEIKAFCGAFKRLFQHMDLICHYCYQPFGSLSDQDMAEARKVVAMAIRLWKRLMPTIPMKVHAWNHLLEDLEELRGMLSHNEQGMERSHQRGKKEGIRLRAHSRDAEKKTSSMLKREATLDSAPVQSMLKQTEESRKKCRKRSPTEERDEDRAIYLKGILMLREIEVEFPTLLELQKVVAALDEAET